MEVHPIDPAAPDPRLLVQAAEVILRGGVVAFPTDSVYGLSCSLMDPLAVDFLYRLKRRPRHLAVIALIGDAESVYPLTEDIPEVAETLMRRFWPGPLSLIFRASPLVPEGVRGERGTIALRYPRHKLSLELLRAAAGPLVSSSANLSGQPPAETAADIRRIFGNQIDLILDGGRVSGVLPSTLVDVSAGRAELVRAGAADVSEYLAPAR